jgi:ribosomal protein L40E
MDAAVNAAITHLLAAVPTLDANEARSALDVAVPINVCGAARFLEELVAHLSTHPDAMGSGDSRCPPVLIRVTHVLHDNGHQVIRPGCAHCGKTVTEWRQLRPEGWICGTCDSRSRLAVCSRCGQQKVRIAAGRPDGKICYRCYNRDPDRFKECSQCGRLDRPVARLDDGTVVCQRCWKPPSGRALPAVRSSQLRLSTMAAPTVTPATASSAVHVGRVADAETPPSSSPGFFVICITN